MYCVTDITPFQPFHDPIRRVKEGEALILRPPSLDSVPNASYTWYAGDRPISDKANSRKFVVTLENALVILDTTLEENGQYHVAAFNLQLDQKQISEPVNVVVTIGKVLNLLNNAEFKQLLTKFKPNIVFFTGNKIYYSNFLQYKTIGVFGDFIL